MNENVSTILDDQPLQVGRAIAADRLQRKGFAATAASSMRVVSPTRGHVVSIEGAWGSGKTSALALVEEFLRDEQPAPVIVRFNPWLVGDRDVLLRQFLSALGNAVRLADHAKEGRRVANELKKYAKAFDVLKLIPGAEPWATLVKSVVEAVGETAGAVSDIKAPDIEAQKKKVEEALKGFPKRIIVFIDDVDRLYPLEVFEMVRIVKAVGDLPNVGYVVAWDPKYVSAALASASVPYAETYLDKIVQIRMPLPALSLGCRSALIDEAVQRLDPEALKSRFPNEEHRFSALYWSGLRELLEQPRDVIRVFNTVALLEPRLRGELAFAEIVGLAALIVKASPLFELLKREPRLFVGNLPRDAGFEDDASVVNRGAGERDEAIQACPSPGAVRELMNTLFPLTGHAKSNWSSAYMEGRLASPSRILVALQHEVSGTEVSFVAAREFLSKPDARERIARSLTPGNCLEFLETLGEVASASTSGVAPDLHEVCLAIARLVDVPPFPERSRDRSVFYATRAENVAFRAIELLVKVTSPEDGPTVALKIVQDPQSSTMAVEVFVRSFVARNPDLLVVCPESDRAEAAAAVRASILRVAKAGRFFETAHPEYVLFRLPDLDRRACPEILDVFKKQDPTLDQFALSILARSYDSNKGQIFELPEDRSRLEAYCDFEHLRIHAIERLRSAQLSFPARAAWMSLAEQRPVYGVDGSNPSH